MTNNLVHLEFACQARKSCKLRHLPEKGNESEVPIGKYSQYTATSTDGIQEEVDKRISELCEQGRRIHFRAGYADPKRVSADNEQCDLTHVSLGRRCRPLAEEASAETMCKDQWTALSGMSPEDEAKLNAIGVPSNPLLVAAIPLRWQRNDRQQIGSKRPALASTGSPGLI
jgi:hypothetical protein